MSDELVGEVGELEAVEEQIEQQVEEAKSEDEEVPPQFRGKSFKDVAKYAYDMEKSLSRQGRELGELRKLTDDVIRSQLKPKEEEKPKEVDFFENPEEAIKRAVESNPKVQAAEQYAVQAKQELTKRKLAEMHPDVGQILSDADFHKWVTSSPVRQQLLVQADKGYDLMAANELLSTYKELRKVRQPEVDTKARDNALKTVGVDSGGSGESSRKVYSRRAIRELMVKNPSKFSAMREEIDAAYRDGRIKP